MYLNSTLQQSDGTQLQRTASNAEVKGIRDTAYTQWLAQYTIWSRSWNEGIR
jgi:hypothetical protein